MKSEIPKISLEVYDLIYRAIGVAPHEYDELLFEALNDVYKVCSHTDSNYIKALSSLESKGRITKDEKLLLFVIHVTARDVGPYDLKKIRDFIVGDNDQEVTLQEIDKLFMNVKLKVFLKDVLVRLNKKTTSDVALN